MPSEPWYRSAVFYGVDIASFADSDGDGFGDLEGLRSKLPYIDSLGVNCIWLLPFHPSPRCDNGYDVTDYYAVDPRLGTLEELETVIKEAGSLGIRVIMDLVMNHTSDQHPWFKAARRDAGSRYRSYYTFMKEPPGDSMDHPSTFPGEEASRWTWDELAGAYYYHPFYACQPDLDFANSEVVQEAQRVMDFWLSFGIAGFRMDAMPLLLGLEEPFPTPPAKALDILRGFRRLTETRHPYTVLLGEVDVEPGQLGRYFGYGDGLNMLLNFQLNAHIWLAMAEESAEPLRQALSVVPLPPENDQWVNFLRNLDELNLAWLSEEGMRSVRQAFERGTDSWIFDRGLRRRVAPMLDGDRARMELAWSLMFSMPGTPLLVYGDEIGLGEDLSLLGREAVRLPMQWSAEDNGGFSAAPHDKLVRPPMSQGPFSYLEVNVEAQQSDDGSFLNWVRRLVSVRNSYGEIPFALAEVLGTDNDQVLAHVCAVCGSGLVVAHNLSSRGQDVAVTLTGHRIVQAGITFGNGTQETDETGLLHLSLPPYGYQWLRCESAEAEAPVALEGDARSA